MGADVHLSGLKLNAGHMMSNTPKQRDPATVEELIPYVRLAKGTIYNKVKTISIPFKRSGRKLVFDLDEVDYWQQTGEMPERFKVAQAS